MSIRAAQIIREEAERLAKGPYIDALACHLEGLPCDEQWGTVERILERAYVLIGLEGMADAHVVARRAGVTDRSQYLKEDFGLEAGPFIEAVRRFEGRVPRLATVLRAMLAKAKQVAGDVVEMEIDGGLIKALSGTDLAHRIASGSFWVTSTVTGELMDLRSILAGILRGDLLGGDLKQLGVDDFITGAQAKGIRHLSANRLETVYRNNLSGSYTEAAAQTLERSDVAAVLPLVMLVEIHDPRTRGAPGGRYPGYHWQMDGFVGTMPDFRRLGILPPNGHQCRGGIRGISLGEAHSNGWVNDDGDLDGEAIAAHNGGRLAIISRGDYPDRGFI